jgi:hypothetical protein
MKNRERFAALLLGLMSVSLAAQETWKVPNLGQAHAKARTQSARSLVEQELMGKDSPAKPEAPPSWLDVNLLATRVFGHLPDPSDPDKKAVYHQGNMDPVAGTKGQDWLLVVVSEEDSRDEAAERIALVRFEESPQGRPTVRVLAMSEEIPTESEPTLPSGVDWGAGGGAGHVVSGGAEWISLKGGKRLLSVPRSRMEGYAGGGASFVSTMLFREDDGALSPVALVPSSSNSMIAGNWNADGTREHDFFSAEWRIQVLDQTTDGWSSLRLLPTTPKTPGLTLRWNSKSQSYVASPGPRRKKNPSDSPLFRSASVRPSGAQRRLRKGPELWP